MSKCKSKRGFDTEDLAIGALIQAHIRFENTTVTNVYQCEDCSLWHLTSKNEPHPDLIEAKESGLIKKERNAYNWEQRLRH